MTGALKAESNRTNARSSTGPKTEWGKARSARNALRHGLSLPVVEDPSLSLEIDALACQIAGKDASPEIQDLARRVAEAQIDLRRVRYVRYKLLSHALGNPDYECHASVKASSEAASNDSRAMAKLVHTTTKSATREEKGTGTRNFATVLADLAQRLSTLDRYERKNLSRRRDAIRALDVARHQGHRTRVASMGPGH
jgi:hypothetical protein